jgi:hypothetical protein
VQRKTLGDYEEFVYGLCGLPPSDECDGCARQIVRQLAGMYRERGLDPPPGLQAFAEKLGVDLNAESNANDST